MERRRFLQAIAATTSGVFLDGGQDDLEALQAITAGLRSLEPTTPSGTLWEPVTGICASLGTGQLVVPAMPGRRRRWPGWLPGWPGTRRTITAPD
jgi:hypothetical protein